MVLGLSRKGQRNFIDTVLWYRKSADHILMFTFESLMRRKTVWWWELLETDLWLLYSLTPGKRQTYLRLQSNWFLRGSKNINGVLLAKNFLFGVTPANSQSVILGINLSALEILETCPQATFSLYLFLGLTWTRSSFICTQIEEQAVFLSLLNTPWTINRMTFVCHSQRQQVPPSMCLHGILWRTRRFRKTWERSEDSNSKQQSLQRQWDQTLPDIFIQSTGVMWTNSHALSKLESLKCRATRLVLRKLALLHHQFSCDPEQSKFDHVLTHNQVSNSHGNHLNRYLVGPGQISSVYPDLISTYPN